MISRPLPKRSGASPSSAPALPDAALLLVDEHFNFIGAQHRCPREEDWQRPWKSHKSARDQSVRLVIIGTR